jgi:DNA mismatch repair protein MutL
MADIIHLLPDSVANQIKAGEVVQRPSSVVKELVENSIDAGADNISIVLKDAGKTLIQVIDNGCGMSETDTRMAFEPHATSKIQKSVDLFAINTMGFRGEALGSIASVSEVELKTRQENNELGTQIIIRGGELIKQENISCSTGCNFLVKNLFYNVPARRKFLKADSTELRSVIADFHRLALAYPQIKFKLINNDTEIHNLPSSNIRQRIVNIFGKQLNAKIVNIDSDTSITKISGFIGDPQKAKKKYGEQYFFVNGRFMKHPYFHKALMNAYDKLLPKECIPSYFIFFELDPSIIDINIHPTKTEIKFQDEQAIFQILNASIRESLGKFNIIPSIDFDEDNSIEIPSISTENNNYVPEIDVNPNYNPFTNVKPTQYNPFGNTSSYQDSIEPDSSSFEHNEEAKVFKSKLNNSTSFQAKKEETFEIDRPEKTRVSRMGQTRISAFNSNKKETNNKQYIQIKNRYIITQVKSGLMMIDQKRAHETILYDKILKSLEMHRGVSQQSLFPETIELNAEDASLLESLMEELNSIGFDIHPFGHNSFIIHGTPSEIDNTSSQQLLERLIQFYKDTQGDIKAIAKENIALSIAKASSIDYNKSLNTTEISHLIDTLFASSSPNFTPEGKKTITILEMDDIKKLLK